ncbi:hypothetical protein ACKFKH_20380 [Phormidesmis sp. 146-20]
MSPNRFFSLLQQKELPFLKIFKLDRPISEKRESFLISDYFSLASPKWRYK